MLVEERGLEQRDERRRAAARARNDRMAATYGGLCAGARNVELLHRREHLVVDEARAADRTGVDGLEADGRQVGQAGERAAGAGEVGDAPPGWPCRSRGTRDPGWPMRSTRPSPRTRSRVVGEEPVLEGRAADVGDEDGHDVTVYERF